MNPSETSQSQNNRLIIGLGVFFIFSLIWVYFNSIPGDFPLGSVVSVKSGESLQEITNNLEALNVIKSGFIFQAHVILQGGEKKLIAGDYLFDRKERAADIAHRLVHGDFHLDPKKITIPEGWSIFQIGDYLEKNLIGFNKKEFLSLAKNLEGYLFPDTYFVSPTIKPAEVIEKMNNTFKDKIVGVTSIATSTYKLKEIITMASILEEEARTEESRRMIAGILWKRLKLGMALQVDSTFLYINGKNTYELTLADLEIDSPYNTYKYRGLPPGPIGNPGLEAINDALNPITSKYLYFLSSKSGDMYYATTFEQHKKNKELYLNK